MLEVFSRRWVVEVDGIFCDVCSFMMWGKYCLEVLAATEGCRKVVTDITGDRVDGCGRLCSAFSREVLGEG